MRRRSRMLAVLGLVAVVLCVVMLVLAPTLGARGVPRAPSRVGAEFRVKGKVVSIKIADEPDVIDAIGPMVEAGRAWTVRIQGDDGPMTLLVHSPSRDLGLGLGGAGHVIDVGLYRLKTEPEMLVPPGSEAAIPDLSRTRYRLATPFDP